MKNILICFVVFSLVFLVLPNNELFAQGDGPRSYSLSPKGILGVSTKWVSSSQNIVPAGNIFLLDSNIDLTLYPVGVFYNFNIGGKFAQAQFMINPGNASGTIVDSQDNIIKGIHNSGVSDGFMALRLGLIGAPALNIEDFIRRSPSISLFGYLRVWYPGSYNPNSLLNLGTNRFTFEMGSQISLPLGNNKNRPIWLESYPYFQFYTRNSNPSIIVLGNEVTQKPLFGIENHLSHNFTSKFWGSIDLHYKIGANTIVDGVSQQNKIHALGGGFTFGYRLLSFLRTGIGYGTILFGDKGIQSNMFRLNLLFLYSKTKTKTKTNN